MPKTTVVLFGATGDLATTKLFPALAELIQSESFTDGIDIIAVGRREYDRASFSSYVRAVTSYKGDEAQWGAFSERLFYYKMDLMEESDYQGLNLFLDEHFNGSNRVYYLSIPPATYMATITNLASGGLLEDREGTWKRVAIEKPFGHDLESARILDIHIAQYLNEEEVFRIDHYLGKETVQNILAFRFSNRMFEPLWNREHIDHIQVTVAEEEGIKNRGPYYDAAGAFRDFVQNHILQLVAYLTLEQPEEFSFTSLSDKKAEVLRTLRPDIDRTVFGQYEGYLQESEIPSHSTTETYAMTSFWIDNERWQGVPVYVRTGKKLAKRITEVSVQFKPSCEELFDCDSSDKVANVLTFRIQPDEGISLRMNVKTPREKMAIQPVNMEFCYSATFRTGLPDAYEQLFQEIVSGDQTNGLRSDTIEESWRIIDAILEKKGSLPLHTYQPGTWGPVDADTLIERDGRRWLAHESTVCNGISIEPLS